MPTSHSDQSGSPNQNEESVPGDFRSPVDGAVGPDAPGALTARKGKDEILVEALAGGMSYPAAAAAAGYTSRTVSRRMEDPAFALRVSRRRGERVAQVTGALTSMSEAALTVLRECMVDGTTAEKLRAAQMTLTLMVRLRHDTEIEERLATIETHLAQHNGGVVQ